MISLEDQISYYFVYIQDYLIGLFPIVDHSDEQSVYPGIQ